MSNPISPKGCPSRQEDHTCASARPAAAIRGVMPASPGAKRYQDTVAFLVVVVPFLGVLAAAFIFWGSGVSAVDLALLVVMYVIVITGVTVGFHRHFAHRSFQAKPWVRTMLAIFGSMASQGPVLFWVATHRRHHVYSDRPGDPHSPNLHGEGLNGVLKGLWHAHIGWMFSREITSWVHYSADHMRDEKIFKINCTYFYWVALGLILPAVTGGLLTWSLWGALSGFIWGGLVRMFLSNHACWCVGSLCHVFGSRRFDNEDHSANNYMVALFTFGEGMQNNHHAFPSSANHKIYWWEPDIAAWIIQGMKKLGWVWDVKEPNAADIQKALGGSVAAA
jgi:stearoyl-CoA desaturase (Delta-9 desaturase)